jgi:predicted transcriptional regulator
MTQASVFNEMMMEVARVSPKMLATLLNRDDTQRIYVHLVTHPSHFTAAEFIAEGFEESTVYRVLERLKKLGLVEKLSHKEMKDVNIRAWRRSVYGKAPIIWRLVYGG